MTEADQPGIPGLDLPTNSDSRQPALEQAVRATLEQLKTLGYLEPRHAVHVSLAIHLAQSITSKLRQGRTSTLANDARELRDLIDSLIPESATTVDKALQDAMASWQTAIESGLV